MDELDWKNQGLTDGDMSVKLNGLSQDETFKKVDFGSNRLQGVPKLNQHKQFESLEYLNLRDNNIENVETQNLPHHVKVVDLRGNRIIKIYDINRDMSFWFIDTFDERFFHNEDDYKQLILCHFCTEWLIQPPKEVFLRGLQSVQTYYKDMTLSKRVRNARKRCVFCQIKLI